MSEQVVVRGPGEGRTLLVGGGDYVTYKTRSDETAGAYFCFEVSTTPGFGPPLHTHAYRELFYVLDGEYEFTDYGDRDIGREEQPMIKVHCKMTIDGDQVTVD